MAVLPTPADSGKDLSSTCITSASRGEGGKGSAWCALVEMGGTTVLSESSKKDQPKILLGELNGKHKPVDLTAEEQAAEDSLCGLSSPRIRWLLVRKSTEKKRYLVSYNCPFILLRMHKV